MKSLISPRTIAIVVGVLIASSAQAQRPRSDGQSVPDNLRPPAGMCRVWVDGVPPDRQPAPTDCASALRNRPSKGRVLFGDDYVRTDSNRHRTRADDPAADSPLKGLAPLPKSLEPKSADANSPGKRAANEKKNPDAHRPPGHKPDSTGVMPPNASTRKSTV
ncbi:MAG: hypothetical protein WBQ26_14045 [Gemmatimonadaceae bacterium]|nr:hypothetical protein [Gemmatimonadaceae bacterium]